MTTSSKERFDVYGAITDQIIASIEAGAEHPQMPWHRAGGSIERPTNVESKNAYRGVNTVALWASEASRVSRRRFHLGHATILRLSVAA